MVDKLVESAVDSGQDTANGLWGPYWSDTDIAVIVFIDAGNDISYSRTINGGVDWSTTEIMAGDTKQVACWYDKETPGNIGNKVHIAWIDNSSDDVYYRTLDVVTETLGDLRTVDAAVIPNVQNNRNRIATTVALSGMIMVAFATTNEIECYTSADDGASWDPRADLYEGVGDFDWAYLYPAATGDDDDVCALFLDRSANTLSIKMFDASAGGGGPPPVGTWTETNIGTMVDNQTWSLFDGAIRHSDSHLLVAMHDDYDSTDDDFRTYDVTVDSIDSPTVTEKTSIYTNGPSVGERAQASVFINQQNDDVYVAYCKGGTWLSSIDIVYHVSDDDMGSWDAEQAYSELSPADDVRLCPAGRTVGDDGGRYMPAFYNDDLADIYVNLNNGVEITAAPAAPVDVFEQPAQYGVMVQKVPDSMVLS